MPHRFIIVRFARLVECVSNLTGHVGSIAGAGWAIIGAIDANSLQLWGGAIVAVLAAIWGQLRDQKRRDFDDKERRKLLQVLVDANATAALAGKPLPYPEVVTMLVKQSGITVETTEPASA